MPLLSAIFVNSNLHNKRRAFSQVGENLPNYFQIQFNNVGYISFNLLALSSKSHSKLPALVCKRKEQVVQMFSSAKGNRVWWKLVTVTCFAKHHVLQCIDFYTDKAIAECSCDAVISQIITICLLYDACDKGMVPVRRDC